MLVEPLYCQLVDILAHSAPEALKVPHVGAVHCHVSCFLGDLCLSVVGLAIHLQVVPS